MRVEIEQRCDAILDPLTGLLNRKALAGRFAEIAEQATLTGAWVSPDRVRPRPLQAGQRHHGHGRGDTVLKDAAYVMRKNLRSFELVYRLGGEEFLIVLPGLRARAEGRALAERLRAASRTPRPGGLPVTASFGVAAARGAEVEFEPLFREADAALYLAKRKGRNQLIGRDWRTPGGARGGLAVASPGLPGPWPNRHRRVTSNPGSRTGRRGGALMSESGRSTRSPIRAVASPWSPAPTAASA